MENKNLYIIIFLVFTFVFGGILFQFIQPQSSGKDNISVVSEDLEIPWAIEFLPSGDMLVTERPGTLLRIKSNSNGFQNSYQIEGVEHRGEGGLLGVTRHPNFEEKNWIYLYMTTEKGDMLQNRVVRYTLRGDQLSNSTVLINDIPGASYHDGGRIDFGPDGKLYITVGDAGEPSWAQDKNKLAGKILRLNPDGEIPESNPFNNSVYSYGHRNPQGLIWVDEQLWATEHGDNQHDELNKIFTGENYGWPIIEADQSRENMRTPEIYAEGTTWAPAGGTYYNGSIFFAGLRGNGLYKTEIENGEVQNLTKHLTEYGRLRAVKKGSDGFLYVSTSNRDGRGLPAENDDKILKVNPNRLK